MGGLAFRNPAAMHNQPPFTVKHSHGEFYYVAGSTGVNALPGLVEQFALTRKACAQRIADELNACR